MRWKSHVRFGGRAGETHRSKDRQGAPVRPLPHPPRPPRRDHRRFTLNRRKRQGQGSRDTSLHRARLARHTPLSQAHSHGGGGRRSPSPPWPAKQQPTAQCNGAPPPTRPPNTPTAPDSRRRFRARRHPAWSSGREPEADVVASGRRQRHTRRLSPARERTASSVRPPRSTRSWSPSALRTCRAGVEPVVRVRRRVRHSDQLRVNVSTSTSRNTTTARTSTTVSAVGLFVTAAFRHWSWVRHSDPVSTVSIRCRRPPGCRPWTAARLVRRLRCRRIARLEVDRAAVAFARLPLEVRGPEAPHKRTGLGVQHMKSQLADSVLPTHLPIDELRVQTDDDVGGRLDDNREWHGPGPYVRVGAVLGRHPRAVVQVQLAGPEDFGRTTKINRTTTRSQWRARARLFAR